MPRVRPHLAPARSATRPHRLAPLLAAALALVGTSCAPLMTLHGSNRQTAFRVYDLGELVTGELEGDRARTLSSMIRDAVGPDEWLGSNSSMHVLDDAMMIRTTPRGHENLSAFFIQFRTVNESP